MIDQRERYERAFDAFEMPEPSLERLLRRRDRRRRNQRVAAGVAGTVVAVLVAIGALRAAVDDAPTTFGTDPSPTPTAGPATLRFESRIHGYALAYPDRWTMTASSRPWTSGTLTRAVADVLRGTGTEGILLEAGSIQIPEGMKPDRWLDREQRRAVLAAGLGGAGFTFVPTIVDGVPGRLSVDCGVVLVAEDRRGYVFRLRGDITVNTDLRAAVRSIELHPEDA